MKRLAVLGASGHGKVVADAAERSGWDYVAFFDDAWPGLDKNGSWSVIGDTKALANEISGYDGVVIAIGSNQTRSVKQLALMMSGARIVSIIHPCAVISEHASVGVGSVVLANAVINPCAVIGDGCIVNTGAVVEHDCVLGDFSHISPNAVLTGGATLGSSAWLGACASVRQQLTVGERAIVGMGAVVTRDVPPGVTVVGNPARERKPRQS